MMEPNDPDPVRVALVGLGNHGRTIQQACLDAAGLEVAAVFDLDEAEMDAAATRFGCDRAASYEELVRRGDLHAVVLVTPNHLHRSQTEAAVAAGLDVFVEKPIANTVADGQAMIAAADASGRVLAVGHNMRLTRSVGLAREMIGAGRLGEVVSVEVHFSHEGARRLPPDAWRLRSDQCPLLPVMQLGIHGIDLVHDLLGPVEEISGYARSVITRPGVVDSVAAGFRLREIVGTMVSNYCTQTNFSLYIAGTEGSIRLTPHDLWYRSVEATDSLGDGEGERHDFRAVDRESYRLQLEDFGRAVRRRSAPAVDGAAGLQALAVVEALQRAVETRSVVRVAGTPAREA